MFEIKSPKVRAEERVNSAQASLAAAQKALDAIVAKDAQKALAAQKAKEAKAAVAAKK